MEVLHAALLARVEDPRDHVGAEPDLAVQGRRRPHGLAGLQIDNVHHERRGPQIHGHAEVPLRHVSVLRVCPNLARAFASICSLLSRHPSKDGSERRLLRLQSGMMIESVLLPRRALCVSSQVGCAVGCQFCKTGEAGLLRQLDAGEILAQLALARRDGHEVNRVVFMGMGEPSHNLASVLEACRYMGTHGLLPHKNLVFSTVGDPETFARLLEHEVRPALSLSLHTTREDLRRELLPRAPEVPIEELIDAADRYARAITWPVQYQWTLLRGVNDSEEEFDRLITLLKDRHGMVNIIPYNPSEGIDFERPSWEEGVHFVRKLRQAGVFATIRRSSAQYVAGACGQLRARPLERA